MILIEVNNRKASSNFALIARTQNWVASNMPEVGRDYVIVLNPNIKGDLKISHHEPNKPHNEEDISQ